MRPQHFAYSRAIGSAQETVLDFDGYRISAACENGSGGRPRLVANMTFPEEGSLDLALTNGEFPTPAQSLVGRSPAPASPPATAIADVDPGAGNSATQVMLATYSAPAHSAELTAHGIADDPAKTCSLTGTLTETG